MPGIDKVISINITAEQFLDACSPTELQELEILLFSPRFQNKRKGISPISIDNHQEATLQIDNTLWGVMCKCGHTNYLEGELNLSTVYHMCEICNKCLDSDRLYLVTDKSELATIPCNMCNRLVYYHEKSTRLPYCRPCKKPIV